MNNRNSTLFHKIVPAFALILAVFLLIHQPARTQSADALIHLPKIGRASCRERV